MLAESDVRCGSIRGRWDRLVVPRIEGDRTTTVLAGATRWMK
jgi:hypothetical protein